MKSILLLVLLSSLISCEVERIESVGVKENSYYLRMGSQVTHPLTNDLSNPDGHLSIKVDSIEKVLKEAEVRLRGFLTYEYQDLEGELQTKQVTVADDFFTDTEGNFQTGVNILNEHLITKILKVDIELSTTYEGKEYKKSIFYDNENIWSGLDILRSIVYEFDLKSFYENINDNGYQRAVFRYYDLGKSIVLD